MQQQEAASEWDRQGASWKVGAYSPALQEFNQHAQIQFASLDNRLGGGEFTFLFFI